LGLVWKKFLEHYLQNLDYLDQHHWPQLKVVIVVESHTVRQGKQQSRRRFFLSSHNYSDFHSY